jgi:site-specific DNA recombinase
MLVQTEIGCIGDPVVAADADAKLARLYAAIEEGVVDAADPNLKGGWRSSARTRCCVGGRQAGRGAKRPGPGSAHFGPGEEIWRRSAQKLRDREGGFRRHYVQAVVQRVEVADEEIRICGSPERLLQAISGPIVGSDSAGVRGFEPRWLPGQDSNLRPAG